MGTLTCSWFEMKGCFAWFVYFFLLFSLGDSKPQGNRGIQDYNAICNIIINKNRGYPHGPQHGDWRYPHVPVPPYPGGWRNPHEPNNGRWPRSLTEYCNNIIHNIA